MGLAGMVTADQASAVTAAPRADWQAAGFGVYVHWPFCLAKCPYCDFNSHVARSVDQAAWALALAAEAGHMRGLTGPRPADTVFFGGGTPSLMAPETVGAVLQAIDRLWGLADGAEITLEANPTSIEAANFRLYAAAGVNRVSIGVQALQDADLRALGRRHSVAEAQRALAIARSTFQRVSFDLIYARRGQSVRDWQRELERALDMAADHMSLYQLTIEEGTRFFDLVRAGRLHLPDDEVAAEMYELTQALTAAAGMPAYEISNHATPGAESRHNLIYWRGGDYAGIGPGAHSRITGPAGRRALTTVRDPARWLGRVGEGGHGIQGDVILSAGEQACEYALMSMRLAEGIDRTRLARLGGALDADGLAMLVEAGLVRIGQTRIRATPAGRIVLNRVLAEMLG